MHIQVQYLMHIQVQYLMHIQVQYLMHIQVQYLMHVQVQYLMHVQVQYLMHIQVQYLMHVQVQYLMHLQVQYLMHIHTHLLKNTASNCFRSKFIILDTNNIIYLYTPKQNILFKQFLPREYKDFRRVTLRMNGLLMNRQYTEQNIYNDVYAYM